MHRTGYHLTIAMNWRGTPLVDVNTIVSLIGSTHSRLGLHVRAVLDRGRYPAGITVTDDAGGHHPDLRVRRARVLGAVRSSHGRRVRDARDDEAPAAMGRGPRPRSGRRRRAELAHPRLPEGLAIGSDHAVPGLRVADRGGLQVAADCARAFRVLFPALRLGYIVVPTDLIARVAAVREATDIVPPTLTQAVLTAFVAEGHFGRHLRRMRTLFAERRTALVDAIREQLDGVLKVVGDEAGMHVAAVLSTGLKDQTVAERAAMQGLWTMPLSSCYLGKAVRQGFVLGFGGTSVPEIVAGVRRLRIALEL